MKVGITEDRKMLEGSGDVPAVALNTRFNLGDWLICPELNRLQHRRSAAQRQIEPRLMHLLCYLAANPNRVLSREQLVQELWPRVFVNENSLTRAISELRKHLASGDKPARAYIETIPKKGYRLLPAIETLASLANSQLPATGNSNAATACTWYHNVQFSLRHAAAAVCLSLITGAWFGLEATGLLSEPVTETRLLADELLELQPGYFGGELTLSQADDPETLGSGLHTIDAPVISNDESRFAYIQHDSAGSTIFMGKLDALATPVVAVYTSPEKLFNLTWSPLGQGLIFARYSKLTNAALFADDRLTAELMLLDLSTLEVHRLLPDNTPPASQAKKSQNLT